MPALEQIVSKPPEVIRNGDQWVLVWPEYEFGAIILRDGTVGQYAGGYRRAAVEALLKPLIPTFIGEHNPRQ